MLLDQVVRGQARGRQRPRLLQGGRRAGAVAGLQQPLAALQQGVGRHGRLVGIAHEWLHV